MKHDNNFDLLRLIAALDVLMQHATHLRVPYPSWVLSMVASASGVPIFFVISGFLVTGSFFKREGELAPYLANRALRIYPGLWLNLLLIFGMLVAFNSLRWPSISSANFPDFSLIMMATGSITVADRLSPVALYWDSGLAFFPGGALWTIIVELGFYLMVPAIFVTWRRGSSVMALLPLAVCTAGSYAVAWWLRGQPMGLISVASPLPYFWMFGLGSMAYLFWPRISFLFEGKFLIWIAVHIAFGYATGAMPAFLSPGPLETVATILLAGSALSFAFTLRGMSRTLLRGTDLSYGVYLHHMPVVMILLAFGWVGSMLDLAALLFLTAIVAALSWSFVERPALHLKPKSSAQTGSTAVMLDHLDTARSAVTAG